MRIIYAKNIEIYGQAVEDMKRVAPSSFVQIHKFKKQTEQNVIASQYRDLKTFVTTDNISQLNLDISSKCTSVATTLLTVEISSAKSNIYQITKTKLGFCLTNSNSGNQHNVNPDLNNCSCPFSCNFGLPCRHIFACRIQEKLPVFTVDLVHNRWRKTISDSGQDACPPVVNIIKKPGKPKNKLTQNGKFRKAEELTKAMLGLLSKCNDKEFNKKMDDLQTLQNLWMSNTEYKIYPENDLNDLLSHVGDIGDNLLM